MEQLVNPSETTRILQLVAEAGPVVKAVLFLLFFLSVASWTVILVKLRALRSARRASNHFLEIFWNSNRLDTIYEAAKKLKVCPLTEVFKAGYIELVNVKTNAKQREKEAAREGGTAPADISKDIGGIDNVHRALRRAATSEVTRLESLVPFLATTGSTAPFIGLFGTVWGIMNSFINIGASKDTSLAVVAPGISEALVATAVGLFAAIPAVVFYNHFLSTIRVLSSEIDNFSNDFINIVKRHFF